MAESGFNGILMDVFYRFLIMLSVTNVSIPILSHPELIR